MTLCCRLNWNSSSLRLDLPFGTYKYKRHRRADGPWLWLAENWEENNADRTFSDVWFYNNIISEPKWQGSQWGQRSHLMILLQLAGFPQRPGNPDTICAGNPQFQWKQGGPPLFNSSTNNLPSHALLLSYTSPSFALSLKLCGIVIASCNECTYWQGPHSPLARPPRIAESPFGPRCHLFGLRSAFSGPQGPGPSEF